MSRLSSKAAIAPLQALCQRVISRTIGSYDSLTPLAKLKVIDESVLVQRVLPREKHDFRYEYLKFDGTYLLYEYIIFGHPRKLYEALPQEYYYILKVETPKYKSPSLEIYGMLAFVMDQDPKLLTKEQLDLIAEADKPRRMGN